MMEHSFSSCLTCIGYAKSIFTINKTCLKTELLEHFETSAVQEQSDGKKVLLVFPDGMHEMFQSAKLLSDYKSEALQISRIARDIRREMFAHEHFKFSGSFPQNCQSISVPYKLQSQASHSTILDGTSSKGNTDSQACVTIAQLIVYNSKKKSKNSASDCKNVRHTQSREPPFPLYLGLKIHSLTRSRKLVEQLHTLGITASYARVTNVESNIANTMCKQFEADCPSTLRKGLVTVGAVDNLDHNPTSTTAQSSFHGTAISITQFPTSTDGGEHHTLVPISSRNSDESSSLLPSYSTIPAVSLNTSKTTVPEKNDPCFFQCSWQRHSERRCMAHSCSGITGF